jgi:PIN domain nuclease of toxin-antitoxin system
MLAFLRREGGADEVEAVLTDPDNSVLAHTINLCEVFYDFARTHGSDVARAAVDDLLSLRVQPRRCLDAFLWQDAGLLKVTHRRISLSDCFCVALARRVDGEILTTDCHQRDRLAPLSVCRIRFVW